jgi:hypothetical protein
MGYNPWINAVKAAKNELASDAALEFYKETSSEHFWMMIFALLDIVYWTVESGRLAREFVDSFSTPEPEAETIIAGLLAPAEDIQPITTSAVVIQTNQERLEQQITQTIKGIYDNVQISENSVQLGEATNQAPLEEAPQLLSGRVDAHQDQTQPVPTRTRKPRASTSDGGQSSNKSQPKSRVSGKGRSV